MRASTRIVLIIFLQSLFFNLFGQDQNAYTIENLSDPKSFGNTYISNPDNILNQEDVATLNQLIADLEDSTTAQVAIVIVNSVGYENPKDFATRLFNHWHIGQADVNNGLLVFSVMDQRRTEFETGYGLEGVLPDVLCYRIGMQQLVPHFREGNYGAGLIAVMSKFKETLEKGEAFEEIRSTDTSYGQPSFTFWDFLQWYFIINFLFHLGVGVWLLLTLTGKDDFYDKYKGVKKVFGIAWIILFPLPYLFVWLSLKGLLKKLRNHPRFSTVTGKAMRKLKESEEDQYLKKGQITEEEIGSADYDVWVTEDADDILVLRYARLFTKYSKCKKCKYTTYYLAYSKIVKLSTYHSTGLKNVRYECKNCGYSHNKHIIIPIKTRSSSSGGGGSSWSGGGGSSSWGGGSSGGGGAGVSW